MVRKKTGNTYKLTARFHLIEMYKTHINYTYMRPFSMGKNGNNWVSAALAVCKTAPPRIPFSYHGCSPALRLVLM